MPLNLAGNGPITGATSLASPTQIHSGANSLVLQADPTGTHVDSVIGLEVDNGRVFTINRSNEVGRLITGRTSSVSVANVNCSFQFHGVGGQRGYTSGTTYRNDNLGPIIALGKSRGTAVDDYTAVDSGDFLGDLRWIGSDGTDLSGFSARIAASAAADFTATSKPGILSFSTTDANAVAAVEHMRIDEEGSTWVGNGTTGTIGTLPSATNLGVFAVDVSNSTVGAYLRTSRDTGSANAIAQFWGSAGQAIIRGDGDLENTNNRYTGISDIKLKQNVRDASSQWEDIKKLKVRQYELIKNPDQKQIGVVAQELEEICPGLVIERVSDEETGETHKSVSYSVLYMKAVKALQEAIGRIEALEAEVAQLTLNVNQTDV